MITVLLVLDQFYNGKSADIDAYFFQNFNWFRILVLIKDTECIIYDLWKYFSVAFRMYDLDGDEKISKEELLAVLTMMVGANISEEQLMSIADRTIHEADEDKDDRISFDEFCKVLERTDVEQKMSIRFLS